ncbi:MAG: ATP-binding protein [Treponema socranskii subsp. buccale]
MGGIQKKGGLLAAAAKKTDVKGGAKASAVKKTQAKEKRAESAKSKSAKPKTAAKKTASAVGKKSAAKETKMTRSAAEKNAAKTSAGTSREAAKTASGGTRSSAAKRLSDIAKRPTPKHGVYDEDSILHLEGLEHIRLRPGMYIGSLGDGSNENDGIYILLKEGIDNAVDEFSQGFGKRIDIDIRDGRVKIRDYGRGIPLGKLDDCVSNVNTGAKYNNTVFKQAIGMNGVGIKATNALSSYFRAASVRDGKMAVVEYAHGEKTGEKLGKAKDGVKNGTYLEFVPDEEIFGPYTFNMDMIEKRLLVEIVVIDFVDD